MSTRAQMKKETMSTYIALSLAHSIYNSYTLLAKEKQIHTKKKRIED